MTPSHLTEHQAMTTGPGVLRVPVAHAPSPYLLRAAIEAALAGRPLGGGPEAAVARAVRDAVVAASAADDGAGVESRGGPSWH